MSSDPSTPPRREASGSGGAVNGQEERGGASRAGASRTGANPPPILTPGRTRALVALLAAIFLLEVYQHYVRIFWAFPNADYTDYYLSVRRLLAGGNPHGGNYVYPIFFDLLILPLGLVGRLTSLALFRLISIAILGVFGWLLGIWAMQARRPKDRGSRVLLWLAAFAWVFWFDPSFVVVRMGQADLVVAGFLLATWILIRHARAGGAGALIGCATLTKVAPVLAAPALLAWRPKRVAFGGVAVALVYALILAVTGLWRWEWNYVTGRLLHRTAETTWNQISLMEVAQRFPGAVGGVNPAVVGWVVIVVVGLAYLGVCIWGRVRGTDGETLLGLGVTSTLAALPVLQYQHVAWILVPLGLVALDAWRKNDAPAWAVPVAAWILLAVPDSLNTSMNVPRFVEFVPIAGVYLLWGRFLLAALKQNVKRERTA